TTFGEEGVARHPSVGGRLYDLLVEPNGRIVAVGFETVGDDWDFVVARFLSDGKLDPEFGGGDGKVTLGFGGDDWAHSVVRAADGKYVVVGTNRGNIFYEDNDIAVAR